MFAVSGAPGERLVIEGGSRHLDNVGARHLGGTLIVEGDVGAYAARNMRAGLLDIRGNAGPYLGAGLAASSALRLRPPATPKPADEESTPARSTVRAPV